MGSEPKPSSRVHAARADYRVVRAPNADFGVPSFFAGRRAAHGGTGRGLRVHYNLVQEHQALGMTPGEAAGIPLGDGFRWKAILKEAGKLAHRNVTEENHS